MPTLQSTRNAAFKLLDLDLYIKTKGSPTYVTPPDTPLNVTWGDYASFKITSIS